eukprot:1139264-Pelagomonas_calceolata.AAC.1
MANKLIASKKQAHGIVSTDTVAHGHQSRCKLSPRAVAWARYNNALKHECHKACRKAQVSTGARQQSNDAGAPDLPMHPAGAGHRSNCGAHGSNSAELAIKLVADTWAQRAGVWGSLPLGD